MEYEKSDRIFANGCESPVFFRDRTQGAPLREENFFEVSPGKRPQGGQKQTTTRQDLAWKPVVGRNGEKNCRKRGFLKILFLITGFIGTPLSSVWTIFTVGQPTAKPVCNKGLFCLKIPEKPAKGTNDKVVITWTSSHVTHSHNVDPPSRFWSKIHRHGVNSNQRTLTSGDNCFSVWLAT